MPLVRLDKVSLAYGMHPLLDGVDLQVRRGERCCLLGRNGEGKSSLLKLIAGGIVADSGEVWVRPGIRLAMLEQEFAGSGGESVRELVRHGFARDARSPESWEREHRLDRVLAELGLDGEALASNLSGGWQRRALLARALVCEPDLLLLDEPTNHLDIAGIEWLEQYLAQFPGAVLFVSHDRSFVRRLAGRVLELDRGVLRQWPGSYDDYVAGKQASLEVEARHAALFDRKLRQEEAWIRQGVEARRTRNEGRVRALYELRRERAARRERTGSMQATLQEAAPSGKLVVETRNLKYGYEGRPLIRDLSVRILRGDRVGIIGPNGCGKSTLIRLLTGDIAPDAGEVRLGTGLKVAYYDQRRAQLDPALSIADNVTGGAGDTVSIEGVTRHVNSYLRDFLFPTERLAAPIDMLSGGERNRLLLARLFAQPVNLLVMDEPTNDLDTDTLDLLEEMISGFSGTLLLVSHDRSFLDNVVTSTLVFEDGTVNEYVGGYADWLRQRRPPRDDARTPRPAAPVRVPAASPRRARRLSYNEARELAGMAERIAAMEAELADRQAQSQSSEFYRQAPEHIASSLARLAELSAAVEAAYARWEALESAAG